MENGYTHIDTAKMYQNEEIVGEAIAECIKQGKTRESIYVCTKLWIDDFNDPEAGCRESLKKLGLEYVDLYLLHWPFMFYSEPKASLHKVWPLMEALVDKGLVKSIGVSNFNT